MAMMISPMPRISDQRLLRLPTSGATTVPSSAGRKIQARM
jgi:hypothetical protein